MNTDIRRLLLVRYRVNFSLVRNVLKKREGIKVKHDSDLIFLVCLSSVNKCHEGYEEGFGHILIREVQGCNFNAGEITLRMF